MRKDTHSDQSSDKSMEVEQRGEAQSSTSYLCVCLGGDNDVFVVMISSRR